MDQESSAKRRRTNESFSGSPTTPAQKGKNNAASTPSQTPVARKLTFTNINAPTGESIKVFLRVRPFAQDEEKSEVNCITHAKGPQLTIKAPKPPMDESKYTFTAVYPPETTQKELFKSTALPLVESFLQGHNGLLFAYGITNAGKTYTITGKPQDTEEKGLLPRILDVIFNSITPADAKREKDSGEIAKVGMDPNMTHWIWLTYYEIYNDRVRDLLDVDSGQKKLQLKLSKDENGKPLGKVNEVAVKTRKEAEECIAVGMKARAVAATALNGDSSRSHAMLTIRLFQYNDPKEVDATPELIRTNKLSIVDLAGSERNQRTQTTGTRLKEAGNINNSLMTLGMCLETLRWNQENPTKPQRIVPFRNSKLTRCLQDYFLKEAKVVMMVNINPCGKDFEETNNVLKFAAVAKEITTTTRLDTRRPALPTTTPATIKKRKAGEEPDMEEVNKERTKRAEAEKEIEVLKQQLESEKLATRNKQDTDKELQILKQREVETKKLAVNRDEEDKRKDLLIESLQQALEDQEIAIRAEVAQEMAEAICKIEDQYRLKNAQEHDSLEELYTKKLEIFTQVAEVIKTTQQVAPVATSKAPAPMDPDQAEKYQKKLLVKEARIAELEASLVDAKNRVIYLNEKIAGLSNNREDTSYLRSKMEQENLEFRLQLETSSKAELDIMKHQITLLKREKDSQLEEIKALKERIDELTKSGKDKDKVKTPSKLQKLAKYGIVDQNVLATTTTSTTTIWKGDVATSMSGDGISVTFTGVETLTPHKISQYPPPPTPPLTSYSPPHPSAARFEDPMQTDGLVMKEARSSWVDISITPPEDKKKIVTLDKKGKGKDKEKTKKKSKKQDEDDDEEEEETRPKPPRAPSTRTIMAVSKKIAHTIIPPSKLRSSPMRTSPPRSPNSRRIATPPPPSSPFRSATPPITRVILNAKNASPLSPKDPNVVSSPANKKSAKITKDKENIETTPSVKSRRKLFDKAAAEKGKFTEPLDDLPKEKRKPEPTPIARRLRSRK